MKSIRVKSPSLNSREEFDDAASRVIAIKTEIDLLKAREARAVQRVKEAYAAKIKPLDGEMKAKTTLANLWAIANRAALLPTEAKCAIAGAARVGFREGNPFTDTLSKWTWEMVIEAMKAKKLGAYLVVAYSAARAKMLADGKGGTLTNDEGEQIALREIGVKLDQEELFYIEPKPAATAPTTATAKEARAA